MRHVVDLFESRCLPRSQGEKGDKKMRRQRRLYFLAAVIHLAETELLMMRVHGILAKPAFLGRPDMGRIS